MTNTIILAPKNTVIIIRKMLVYYSELFAQKAPGTEIYTTKYQLWVWGRDFVKRSDGTIYYSVLLHARVAHPNSVPRLVGPGDLVRFDVNMMSIRKLKAVLPYVETSTGIQDSILCGDECLAVSSSTHMPHVNRWGYRAPYRDAVSRVLHLKPNQFIKKKKIPHG